MVPDVIQEIESSSFDKIDNMYASDLSGDIGQINEQPVVVVSVHIPCPAF
jgi:hypothetical protein